LADSRLCDFFAGFQARLCIAEDLTLTPRFFMTGCASGCRFDFSYLFPLFFWFK
jgi:hypothetical protein